VTDIVKVLEGAIIRVHNSDFSRDSEDVGVKSIIGVTIETDKDMGFIPQVDDRVDLVGYLDGGGAYRWL